MSSAQRLYDEMVSCLSQSQDSYDTSKIVLRKRSPRKTISYYAIEIFGQSCLNFKDNLSPYVEIAPRIASFFDAAGFVIKPAKASGWKLVNADDISFTDSALVPQIYEAYLPAGGFNCCSHFMECSDAMHCIHPDIMFACQCTYRQKLKQGIIFFGNNRNV